MRGLNKYDEQQLDILWKDAGYLVMNPILLSSFAERISNGEEVVTDGGRITLHTPAGDWYGWNADDSERFSAVIGTDGRIAIGTSEFNVFRPVEGMTVDEVMAQVTRIQIFTGILSADTVAPPVAMSEPIDASENNPAAPLITPDEAMALLKEDYAEIGIGYSSAEFQAVTTLWETVELTCSG
ncbi:MAG: hypothetical protein LBB94_11825 [Clostridiales bacterium]|nr:hypothetical protein [Clostridiales bacterium]